MGEMTPSANLGRGLIIPTPDEERRRLRWGSRSRYHHRSSCSGDECSPPPAWAFGLLAVVIAAVIAWSGWRNYLSAMRRRELDEEFLADTSNSRSPGGGNSSSNVELTTTTGATACTSVTDRSPLHGNNGSLPPPPHFPPGRYGGRYGDTARYRRAYPNIRTHHIPPFEMTFVEETVPGMFTVHGGGHDRIGEYILRGRHANNPFRMVLTKTYEYGTRGVAAATDVNGRREGYYLAEDGEVHWSDGAGRDDPMGCRRVNTAESSRASHWGVYAAPDPGENRGHEVHVRLTECVEEGSGQPILTGRYFLGSDDIEDGGSISFWPIMPANETM